MSLYPQSDFLFISEDQNTFLGALQAFMAGIWAFLFFLPTRVQRSVPVIEPLTVQSLE